MARVKQLSAFVALTYLIILNSGFTPVSASKMVETGCKLYLPNVFSPNNDGINDTFLATTDCVVESFEIKIFNRWGFLLYQSTSLETGWDGFINGKAPVQDAYVYAIKVKFQDAPRAEVMGGQVSILLGR